MPAQKIKNTEQEIDKLLRQCACLIPEEKSSESILPEKQKERLATAQTIFSTSSAEMTSRPNTTDIRKYIEKSLPEKVGRYLVLDKIGQGGMGEVYRAQDNLLHRVVALKTLITEDRLATIAKQRFLREAKSIGQIRHPRIVSVYDLQEVDDSYVLVMQYIKGGSLADLLQKEKLSVKRSCEVILSILEGISYAHDQGIIHRDLKPANILIDEDNDIYISDFGLAKLHGDEDEKLSRTGEILGTPAYMPPEQAQGKKEEVDPQSDVYSVGVIFYEMLTGEAPFQGENPLVVLYQVIKGKVSKPRTINPKIPPTLEAICLKALARNKRDRYSSAQKMIDDIQAFFNKNDRNQQTLRVNQLKTQRIQKQLLEKKKTKRRFAHVFLMFCAMAVLGLPLFGRSDLSQELQANMEKIGENDSSSPTLLEKPPVDSIKKDLAKVENKETLSLSQKNTDAPASDSLSFSTPIRKNIPRTIVENRLNKRKELALYRKSVQRAVKRMDQNQDGKISNEEWGENIDTFNKLDRNGSRYLEKNELKLWQKNFLREENTLNKQIFHRLDKNNDKKIEVQEWPRDPKAFCKIDVNNDYLITQREWEKYHREQTP